MALADHYDNADVLDTLSWVALSVEARIAKLTSLYIHKEDVMVDAHRNYEGPTLGTVRVFVKSVYDPPRGQGMMTYKGVLNAIPVQKKCQEARSRRPSWTWKRSTKQDRRNAVAAAVMTVWGRCYNNKKIKVEPNCVGITQIAGCRLIIIGGTGYRPTAQPRFLVRHLATGQSKVVVVDGKPLSNVTQLLTRLAPRGVLRGCFEGKSITFDYAGGFIIDGELVPWRNIRGIYPASKAHKTVGEPKRKDDCYA